jgi:hypothetical protein
MEDLVGYGVWLDDFEPASASHRRVINSLLRFLDSQGVCFVTSVLSGLPSRQESSVGSGLPGRSDQAVGPLGEALHHLAPQIRESARQAILGTGPVLDQVLT